MVLIDNKKGQYINGFMQANLDIANKGIHKDLDMLFCYDGGEGSGKSTCAMQHAFYVDRTFCVDRMVFTPNEFRNAIIRAGKYQAIQYDEAYTGMSSRAAMSLINRTLISMLAEIRQKNLFIFVVMPTFFDLDKYVALWRSRALVHVYMGDGFTRGNFAFYNTDRKKNLYILGKKFYNYNCVKPNFIGDFTNWYPIDEAVYRKKKHDSLVKREQNASDAQVRKEIEDNLFIKLVETQVPMTHEAKAKLLGLPIATYYYKLRNYNDKRELFADT